MIEKGFDKKLVLAGGSEYFGKGFGADGETVTEIVFNTSPVGYQEILSDPSYTYQSVVMAYPLMGNYGMAKDDYETSKPTIGGLICRDINHKPSNFRSEETLSSVMARYNIVGLSGIDTRKLVREIRDKGTCPGIITGINTSAEECAAKLKAFIPKRDAVGTVSRKQIETYEVDGAKLHIAAIDCGMKENIIRSFNKNAISVTVFPWNTKANELMSETFDGVFISNGPGDPTDVPEVAETIKQIIGKKPVFGICLGHQIISLAYGAKTYKLKFGHRGGNHPVKNLLTGKIEITSQNHSYAVDKASLAGTGLTVTHINLLDDTVEGARSEKDRVMSVQYHPESAPGPQDSSYLFEEFYKLTEAYHAKKN